MLFSKNNSYFFDSYLIFKAKKEEKPNIQTKRFWKSVTLCSTSNHSQFQNPSKQFLWIIFVLYTFTLYERNMLLFFSSISHCCCCCSKIDWHPDGFSLLALSLLCLWPGYCHPIFVAVDIHHIQIDRCMLCECTVHLLLVSTYRHRPYYNWLSVQNYDKDKSIICK